MKVTFKNLIDANTGEKITVDVPEDKLEQFNRVGRRAAAFGRRCREMLDISKRK